MIMINIIIIIASSMIIKYHHKKSIYCFTSLTVAPK